MIMILNSGGMVAKFVKRKTYRTQAWASIHLVAVFFNFWPKLVMI